MKYVLLATVSGMLAFGMGTAANAQPQSGLIDCAQGSNAGRPECQGRGKNGPTTPGVSTTGHPAATATTGSTAAGATTQSGGRNAVVNSGTGAVKPLGPGQSRENSGIGGSATAAPRR